MNVLIADDDALTRSLLRRVLVREFSATVIEAGDGLEALSVAGRTPPDLVITDLRMPVMDGLSLLEALRQCAPLASIPVVMMTAARESEPVRRAIELGVTDYLLKPLQVAQVNGRLRAVFDRISRRLDGHEPAGAPDVDERTPVLIADGNADFRHFVATVLGSTRAVYQAASGVAALQRCVEVRPGLVLIGAELGVLGADVLLRRLRALPDVPPPRVFLVVAKQLIDQAPGADQADGVLSRTFVSDDFRQQFDRQVGQLKARPQAGLDRILSPSLASAAEAVLAAWLGQEVAAVPDVGARPADAIAVASVDVGRGPDTTPMTLVVRTDAASATRLAATRVAGDAAAANGTDPAAAVAALLGALAARVDATLQAAGVHVTFGEPVYGVDPAGDLADAPAGAAVLGVQSADAGVFVVVQLVGPAPVPIPTAAVAAAVPAT